MTAVLLAYPIARISDRTNQRVLVAALGLLIPGTLMVLLPFVDSGLGKLALITVALGYYAASFTPNIWSIIQSSVRPQAVGPAAGIINGIGADGGGTAAGFLVGMLYGSTGSYVPGFTILGGLVILGGLSLLIHRRTTGRSLVSGGMKTLLPILAMSAALGAPAQAQPLPWPPPGRTDETRMSGDIAAPPVGETLQPDIAGLSGAGQLPPPDTTPAISMMLALAAAQVIVASCQSQGHAVAADITDSAGVLHVGLSADGASPPGRLFSGVPKAVAAIAFRQPTSRIRALLRVDPARVSGAAPNMLVLPGGLPIIVRGTVLGAIGVSGASTDQDEACAQSGLDAIMPRLFALPEAGSSQGGHR